MHAINNISGEFNTKKLHNGLYIVIHNPNQPPPHILLIFNKKYYSLAYNKCVIAGDAIKLLNIFNSKNTALLLINTVIKYSEKNEQLIQNVFTKYTIAGKNNTTCLSPIKECLSQILNLLFANVNFIYDMIPLLELNNVIIEVKHINLANAINNSTYFLANYNQNDILTKIKKLQHKKNYESTYSNKL